MSIVEPAERIPTFTIPSEKVLELINDHLDCHQDVDYRRY